MGAGQLFDEADADGVHLHLASERLGYAGLRDADALGRTASCVAPDASNTSRAILMMSSDV